MRREVKKGGRQTSQWTGEADWVFESSTHEFPRFGGPGEGVGGARKNRAGNGNEDAEDKNERGKAGKVKKWKGGREKIGQQM